MKLGFNTKMECFKIFVNRNFALYYNFFQDNIHVYYRVVTYDKEVYSTTLFLSLRQFL